MYAYLEHASRGRGHVEAGPDDRPGLLGSITFQQLAGPAQVYLTLWDSAAGAADYRAERAGLAALPGQTWEVIGTGAGPAAAQVPACAGLAYFDGPRAPEQAAAGDLAGRQRIWPAIRDVRGLVGSYVLRGEDLATVIINLATSVESLDAITHAVLSTELMPEEDPALLPGPDRVEVHQVTGYHLRTAVAAAVPEGH